MRTLKKVLALSLVCAMAFTMLAGAAFKDSDKIDADLTSDIELMTALSVFIGDENGNFNPEANVTRAQAAKLIYVLKNNGNDDGAKAFTNASPYADVAVGFWGEGYINFCTNSGYMSGWAQDGLRFFDPDATVKGVELAKMLLGMIGYKADLQGYAGANWKTAVIAEATEAGIFSDYMLSTEMPVARQWSAKMLANSINAASVSYSKGELVVSDKTYGEKVLKLESYTGMLKETKGVALSATPAKGAVTNASRSVVVKTVSGTSVASDLNYDAPAKLLGQNVKVYYKAGVTETGATAEEKLAKATKIYSVMASDSRTYNVKFDEIKVDGASISFPGFAKKSQAGAVITAHHNYVPAAAKTISLAAADAEKELKALNLGKNINQNVTIVTDSTGKITNMFETIPNYAVVKTVDTAKNKLTLVDGATSAKPVALTTDGAIGSGTNMELGLTDTGKENWKKLNLKDTLAVGDVVTITPNFTTGVAKFDISKTASVSGKVTTFGVGTGAYTSLTVDGTAYKVSGNLIKGYLFSTADNTDAVKARDAETFYTDGKYLVYATGEKAAETFTKNLAYVIDAVDGSAGLSGTTAKVQLLLSDNSVKTLNYTKTDDQPSKAIDLWKTDVSITPSEYATKVVKNMVYDYVMAEDGTVSLKPLAATTGKTTQGVATNVITYSKDDKAFKIDSTTAKMGADTIVFAKYDTDKYAAVKSSELTYDIAVANKNINIDGRQFAYSTATGLPVVTFGVVNFNTATLPSATATGKFAVVTGGSSMGVTVDKNNSTVVLPVSIDGAKTTLNFKVANDDIESTMSKLNAFKNKLIEYNMKGDYVDQTAGNDVKLVAPAAYADGMFTKLAIGGFNATSLYGKEKTTDTNGTQFYNITADTKVIYVSVAADGTVTLVEDGALATSATYEEEVEEKVLANALVLGKAPTATDAKTLNATTIVVEVNGNNISALVK